MILFKYILLKYGLVANALSDGPKVHSLTIKDNYSRNA